MTSITLITAQSDLLSVDGQIGFLFETAPDGALAARYPDALTMAALIGDLSATKQRASDLAANLLANEPALRGVQQLRVFEQLVIHELQHIFHAINLHERLRALRIGSCEFSGPSRYAAILSSLSARTGSEIAVSAPPVTGHPIASSLKRGWRRLQTSGLSRETLGQELRLVLERADPFHTLPLWRKARGSWQKGET